MSINPARSLRIAVSKKEAPVVAAAAAAPKADASDWKNLPADSYKSLPLLRKTDHGVGVDIFATEQENFKGYSEEELKELELTVSEGSLRIGGNQLLQDRVLSLGYVMFPDGKIFVSKMQIGKIYHSSFCVGREPIAAGMMKIIRGNLSEINEESGHYAPKGAATHVIKRLFDLGLRELEDCVIRTSRYSPVLNDRRSPLDKRAEKLREILSAKGSHSPNSNSASPSPPQKEGRHLKEKTLTPRQLAIRTIAAKPPLSEEPKASGEKREPDIIARFKSSIVSYPKDNL